MTRRQSKAPAGSGQKTQVRPDVPADPAGRHGNEWNYAGGYLVVQPAIGCDYHVFGPDGEELGQFATLKQATSWIAGDRVKENKR